MKIYIEIPTLQKTWGEPIKTFLIFGFSLLLQKEQFKVYHKSGLYPKGEKKGMRIFTLGLHIGNHSIKFTLYKPMTILSWEKYEIQP